MRTYITTSTLLALTWFAANSLAFGQVRDAASKVVGDYAHGRTSNSGWYAQRSAAVPATTPAPIMTPAPSVAARAAEAPVRAETAPDVTRLAQQPPATRRFSYEPGSDVATPRYAPSRSWRRGFRDAGSKVRGEPIPAPAHEWPIEDAQRVGHRRRPWMG